MSKGQRKKLEADSTRQGCYDFSVKFLTTRNFAECVCAHACMFELSRTWFFPALRTVAHQASLSIDSPGKNTGVGFHLLLQGIFLDQGSNSSLLHWQTDFFITEPLGKPNDTTKWYNMLLWIYQYILKLCKIKENKLKGSASNRNSGWRENEVCSEGMSVSSGMF